MGDGNLQQVIRSCHTSRVINDARQQRTALVLGRGEEAMMPPKRGLQVNIDLAAFLRADAIDQ